MLSVTESFTSSISMSIMANSEHCAFCFHKDSFSLKNSWYLCREHLTDFNRLFVIGNDCAKRLWQFMWSIVNLQKVTDILCMLTLRTLLFILNSLSTAAGPWFKIGNDCGKRLWQFIWSMINLQEVIDLSCKLTWRTLFFTLTPLSTAAGPWHNASTSLKTDGTILQLYIFVSLT